jgi:uncharacterized protein (DUF849 family)
VTKKIILTCAVTGSADTAGRNPNVPVTPRQIAASSVEAAQAGASAVHIHVRDPASTLPSMDVSLYSETVELLRSSGTDVIINLTTGPGQRFEPDEHDPSKAGPRTTVVHPAKRIEHVLRLRPHMCSLDVSTMNTEGALGDTIMLNTPKQLRFMASQIRAAGTKPELEVFDTGQVLLARDLVESGLVDDPPYFQFALGIKWGAPATAEAISFMKSLLPQGALWAAFGISRHSLPTLAMSVAMGGHARVGLEDNLYVGAGKLAPSNAALVRQAVEQIEALGCQVASPAEARELLHIS